MRVVVIGGTGFLGREVVAEVRRRGSEAVAVARGARPDGPAPDAVCDVTDRMRLSRLLIGGDVIVDCVGKSPVTRPPGGRATYRRAHVTGVAAIIAAARSVGARRIVYLSALGVTRDAGAPYAETKARAERYLERAARAGIEVRIIAPSLLIGRHGELARIFRLLARLPLLGSVVPIPLPAIDATFRPIDVADAATAVVDVALAGSTEAGHRDGPLPLVGPAVVTMTEVAEHALHAAGRRTARLPRALSRLLVAVISRIHLPGAPAHLRQMLALDNAGPALAPAHGSAIDWTTIMQVPTSR